MLHPLQHEVLIVMLVLLLAIAVATDLLERRIPNRLILLGVIVGLVTHTGSAGLAGLATAGFGIAAGLLCLLPLYGARMLAAGDVKLMAMCGAFLGPLHVALAAAASLVIGGALGVAWMAWQMSTDGTRGADSATGVLAADVSNGAGKSCSETIPYAVAISGGVLAEFRLAFSLDIAALVGV